MEAIAHSKEFAKKAGVSQSVGKDFAEADKGKNFKKGGINMATKKRSTNPAMAMMAARAMPTPSPAPMSAPSITPGMAPGMKKGGKTMKKMAMGGSTKEKAHEMKQSKQLAKLSKEEADEAKGMCKGGSTMKKMASGGATSSRADGIAQRGKTKTRYC